MADEILVTVSEAARRLAIARSHFYVQLQRGLIPSVRIGRSRRIYVRDLEAFAMRQRDESVAHPLVRTQRAHIVSGAGAHCSLGPRREAAWSATR